MAHLDWVDFYESDAANWTMEREGIRVETTYDASLLNVLEQRWKEWLQLPPQALSERLRDLGMEAREMRQVTPFAGLLTARERAGVLKQLRKDIDA